MSEHDVDVVVIGMGPGGEYAAGELAEAGLAVAGVEGRLVGGECPYWGCVPSKMMIRAANLVAEGRRIPGMAGASTVRPDWAPVAGRIRDEATDNWDDTVAADRFTGKGGRFPRAWGRIIAPGRVAVGGDVLRARRGDRNRHRHRAGVPPGPRPGRHAVLDQPRGHRGRAGAGVADRARRRRDRVELARSSPASAPGSPWSRGPTGCCRSRSRRPASCSQGVPPGGHRRADRRERRPRSPPRPRGSPSTLADGGRCPRERLLVATGAARRPGRLGVAASASTSSTRCRSTGGCGRRAGVWAIGDMVGKGEFTHMSMYQAAHSRRRHPRAGPHPGRVSRGAAGHIHRSRDRLRRPERGGGRAQGWTCDRGRQIPASTRGWIHKAGNDGFIKLVADTGRGVLVGATSAGPSGGEVLSMLTLAVHAAVRCGGSAR